jgi:hypothetical protein
MMLHTQKGPVRRFVLEALRSAEGSPMADGTLRSYIRQGFEHMTFTETDLGEIISGLDREGYIAGTTRKFDGVTVWVLTDKGTLMLR